MINKTQLRVFLAFDRGIIHRDYIAHFFRWSHVARHLIHIHSHGKSFILDVGCGDFQLAKTIYVNKQAQCVKEYIGLDIRNLSDEFKKLKTNFPMRFIQHDCRLPFPIKKDWAVITCFEALEHIEREDGLKLLDNLLAAMNVSTTLFLSTPCCDGHKANNHIYEWGYDELKVELEKRFKIEKVFGTFASQRDLLPVLTAAEQEVFDGLWEYYDSNSLAVMLAPLHPEKSRNCLWCLRK